MNPQLIMGTIVSFLHDLFTAVWIGGMFILLFVTLPGLKKSGLDAKLTQKTALTIQKRLKPFVIVSIVGIILTGILISKRSGLSSGPLSFSSPYGVILSIKHIFTILMLVLATARTVIITKMEKNPSPKLEKPSVMILAANLACGLIVLFLSALLSMMH